ncbi:Gldg family protein [Candidatus Desantisbacteria bacterium]|nr:Gldg family protein [Candidatus Desantisbacteria bacterium]
MEKKSKINSYSKFLLYFIVVVLLNVVSIVMFFRMDLTNNKVFSLSEESKKAVETLSEPLTIKIFFTNKLPAPYNNIERYLHDLLEEYSISSNKYFNYEFYDVSSEKDEKVKKNQELAETYGIYPVQVQNIEQDEVKFQKAFMGIVLIHGDLIEALPPVTTTEGLEFNITSTIRKMNNKISALLNLKDKIEIKLFLSSSLQTVGPYMNLSGLNEIPKKIEEAIDKLNKKNYDKLKFAYIDPSQVPDNVKDAEKYGAMSLQWNEFTDRRSEKIPGGKGYIDLVVVHGEKFEKIQILKVIRLPIIGTQYQLANMNDLEKSINEIVENIINTNEEIGYIADHGTLSLEKKNAMFGQQETDSIANFNALLSESYSLKRINLNNEEISDGIPTLIIAGAKEQFSEYELYQIDQFLMKGRNIAIFYDPFNEIMPPQQGNMMFGNQGPFYIPLNTGLERLLEHYGFNVKKSYVMDQNCYKQEIPNAFGGGEQKIYFAPIIKNDFINKDMKFLSNIKGLIMVKASPVEIDEQKVKTGSLKASKLVSSSEKAWEMTGRINLNPMLIQPPADEKNYKQVALAYVLEGTFSSYFAGKGIPVKEEKKEETKEEGKNKKDDKKSEKKPEGVDMSNISNKGSMIEKSIKPGRIFFIGTSEMLKNNILDKEAKSPNAQFVINIIDYLNGKESRAIMRSKSQRFNPLKEIKPESKTKIKTANIAGLPVLIILIGLVMWFKRSSRKRSIEARFRK